MIDQEETVATESIHICVTSRQTSLNTEEKYSLTLNVTAVDKLFVVLCESV